MMLHDSSLHGKESMPEAQAPAQRLSHRRVMLGKPVRKPVDGWPPSVAGISALISFAELPRSNPQRYQPVDATEVKISHFFKR
jgi:hypothetical protein